MFTYTIGCLIVLYNLCLKFKLDCRIIVKLILIYYYIKI